MIKDFISLIFPEVCVSCGKSLAKNEYCICTLCLYHLPVTNYHKQADNPVSKLFWGRANIHSAAAFYSFGKGSKVQHLVHQLKYRGRKEIGVTVGKLYGKELLTSDLFKSIDVILPIPLHIKKKRKRGYNQSDLFAEGLSESMNIEYKTNVLARVTASSTQTKKSRFNRWKNVESIFEVKKPELLERKHILLVDDVVTTGSTLEACAQTILKIPDTKVSIAAIAYAAL